MKFLKTILKQTGLVIISLIIAFLSLSYQIDRKHIIGNSCTKTIKNPNGLCYKGGPEGGFPFIFLKDAQATSVVGSLGPEDHWYLLPFISNVTFYFILLNLPHLFYKHLKKG